VIRYPYIDEQENLAFDDLNLGAMQVNAGATWA
jgi:hypothetical protein